MTQIILDALTILGVVTAFGALMTVGEVFFNIAMEVLK